MASNSKSRDKGKKRKKDKGATNTAHRKKYQKQPDNPKETGCFYCRAEGHVKKQCANYHAWRAKKGTLLNLVCSEVNLNSVPKDIWWMDSGETTHIRVSMQGCLYC